VWRKLLSQVQIGQNGPVPIDVFTVQVVEQATTLTHQFQQARAGGEIFLVGFEVFRQRIDAVREQGNL
jgi:hypothetical protein